MLIPQRGYANFTLVSMLWGGWCRFKCCPCSLSYLVHSNLDQTCLIFLLVSGPTNRTVRCQNPNFLRNLRSCVMGARPNSMLLEFNLILHICCIGRCFVSSISLSQTYHYCVLCKLTGECYKNTDKHMGMVTKKTTVRRAHNSTKTVMCFCSTVCKVV